MELLLLFINTEEKQTISIKFSRFEQGIKNMQTLLVNRFQYVRSTFIPKTGYTSKQINARLN